MLVSTRHASRHNQMTCRVGCLGHGGRRGAGHPDGLPAMHNLDRPGCNARRLVQDYLVLWIPSPARSGRTGGTKTMARAQPGADKPTPLGNSAFGIPMSSFADPHRNVPTKSDRASSDQASSRLRQC
jgi:hypothetical protein